MLEKLTRSELMIQSSSTSNCLKKAHCCVYTLTGGKKQSVWDYFQKRCVDECVPNFSCW